MRMRCLFFRQFSKNFKPGKIKVLKKRILKNGKNQLNKNLLLESLKIWIFSIKKLSVDTVKYHIDN
jgi:hypothetical protein